MDLRSRRGSRGFTLVELLVVIGIIALLVSILLPTLNSARKSAQGTVCGNNLRSQVQAAHLYANEESGWFPNGVSAGRWPVGGLSSSPGLDYTEPAAQALLYNRGLIEEVEMFYCPSKDAGLINTARIPVFRELFETKNYRNLFTSYPWWSNWRNNRFYTLDVQEQLDRGELVANKNNQNGIIVTDLVGFQNNVGFDAWANHVEDKSYVSPINGRTYQAKAVGGRIGRSDGSVIFEYLGDLELRYREEQPPASPNGVWFYY